MCILPGPRERERDFIIIKMFSTFRSFFALNCSWHFSFSLRLVFSFGYLNGPYFKNVFEPSLFPLFLPWAMSMSLSSELIFSRACHVCVNINYLFICRQSNENFGRNIFCLGVKNSISISIWSQIRSIWTSIMPENQLHRWQKHIQIRLQV